MLSGSENKKKPEDLLKDFNFVEKLIKLSNEEDIKRELSENLAISNKDEIDTLSHEVFEIINKLKNMDEADLLKISGGVEERGVVGETVEVTRLGIDVGKDIGAGNVPQAILRLGKDAVDQALRYAGSWLNYWGACNRYEAAVKQGNESKEFADYLNKSNKEISDMKHGIALAALVVVGSAAVLGMFKTKNKKEKKKN